MWPTSQVALEIFREKQRTRIIYSENIFNTPRVTYSWDIVLDALIEPGVVKQEGSGYYIVNMPGLLALIREENNGLILVVCSGTAKSP